MEIISNRAAAAACALEILNRIMSSHSNCLQRLNGDTTRMSQLLPDLARAHNFECSPNLFLVWFSIINFLRANTNTKSNLLSSKFHLLFSSTLFAWPIQRLLNLFQISSVSSPEKLSQRASHAPELYSFWSVQTDLIENRNEERLEILNLFVYLLLNCLLAAR